MILGSLMQYCSLIMMHPQGSSFALTPQMAIQVEWKAVTGADKYYIYRSTNGKNFKYWESTTKTSYINTGAKRNTRYYYKVKAVCAANSNANSARSASVSIKATK